MKAENPNIAVIGTGYIGTVFCCALANENNSVLGIDLDEKTVNQMNKGITSIHEPGISEKLSSIVEKGFFHASTDYSELSKVNTIIVTVGTPLSEDLKADLSQVNAVAEKIGKNLKENTLICLKSTVIPGTTERFSQIISEESRLTLGKDFYVAFSPERIAEGNALDELNNFPIVIGSNDKKSLNKCTKFWESSLGVETVSVSSFISAELTKLADNLWIDVNISLANLISSLAFELGVDSKEIITAANSLPKGSGKVNILNSSIGVGGSCLTKDPLFFANLLDEHGIDSKVIRTTRKLNDSMPLIYIEKLNEWLTNKNIKEPRIGIIGLAFKSDTNDLRYTPMKIIFEQLKKKGQIKVHDPYVKKEEFENLVNSKVNFQDLHETIKDSHILLFGCNHSQISEEEVLTLIKSMEPTRLIIDGRAGYKKLRELVGKANYISI